MRARAVKTYRVQGLGRGRGESEGGRRISCPVVQGAASDRVAPLLLDLVRIVIDQLIVVAVGVRGDGCTEVEVTLISVLTGAIDVEPTAACRIGDRLVVLVTDHVEFVVSDVTVGPGVRAAAIAVTRREPDIGLVRPQRQAVTAYVERAVVCAIAVRQVEDVPAVAERVVAGLNVVREEQEVN